NRVRLTFRSAANLAGGKRAAAAVTTVALGPAALHPLPIKEELGPAAVRDTDLGGARRRAFVPGATSRLSFYLQLPPGALLAFGYGAPAAGGQARVRVAVDGQPTRLAYESAVTAKWTDAVVDLGAAGGRAARID